jgi:hypothetical protein
VSNINPGVLFGIGTWDQIKDMFLLGVGDKYTFVQESSGKPHNNMLPYLIVYMEKNFIIFSARKLHPLGWRGIAVSPFFT